AQTGTGKTAAFSIPMLQILHEDDEPARPGRPRALVLAPTRELALQIKDACVDYGSKLDLTTALVFGGVGQMPQVKALQKGVDILIATPGRLLDLMNQGHCKLTDIDILVLDEADRMLDMGFLPDVRRILQKCPKERQTLLFSATMPADITALANKILFEPVRVEVTPPAATADRVEQSVYHVQKAKKRELLVQLLEDPAFVRTLVFTRTKHGADRVAKHLLRAGIPAHAIHGNKSQGARERALGEFRAGKAIVLVATDIAARGIDVPEISHVVNFDLPNVPESYVHRIGRTARAGRAGIAISFCDEGEHEYLRDIQKLIKQRIPTLRQQDIGKKAPPAGDTDGDERPRRKDDPDHQARLRPEPRHAPGPYANSDEVRRPPRPKKPLSAEERRRRGEVRPGGRKPAKSAGPKPKGPSQPPKGSGKQRGKPGRKPAARSRR
ncbi:MAG: DEAD/DEAH box helicase, partial [Planctomycetes bacterium]|nr:DEAD/DEAH box helicase [Planctomycetota bacterium]